MTTDPSIQRLVEQVGPLLDATRRSRLTPWMNGSPEMMSPSIMNSVKNTATAAVHRAASWAYHSLFSAAKPSAAPQQNVMQPAVFAYLVRQVVTGKATSQVDYYLYGAGSKLFSSMYDKGAQLYETVSNLSSHLKLS